MHSTPYGGGYQEVVCSVPVRAFLVGWGLPHPLLWSPGRIGGASPTLLQETSYGVTTNGADPHGTVSDSLELGQHVVSGGRNIGKCQMLHGQIDLAIELGQQPQIERVIEHALAGVR